MIRRPLLAAVLATVCAIAGAIAFLAQSNDDPVRARVLTPSGLERPGYTPAPAARDSASLSLSVFDASAESAPPASDSSTGPTPEVLQSVDSGESEGADRKKEAEPAQAAVAEISSAQPADPPAAPLSGADAATSPQPAPPTQAPTAPRPPTATATPRPPSPTPTPRASSARPAPASGALSSVEDQLFEGQNAERVKAGLPPLILDPTLVAIARQRVTDMVGKGYFDHTSPTGESVFTLLAAYGRRPSASGENIAFNNYPESQCAAVALRGFMNSGPHRANILNPAFRLVGVAELTAANGSHYFSVVFTS